MAKITQYRRGVNNGEKVAAKLLKKMGMNVMESRGSKGPFDLIAWDDKTVLFIQVKYGETGITTQELNKLKTIKIPPGTLAQVWHKYPYNKSFSVITVHDERKARVLLPGDSKEILFNGEQTEDQ